MLIYVLFLSLVASNGGFQFGRQARRTPLMLACTSDLSDLTVPQLKTLLKDKGLPVSGRKLELIERLSGEPVAAKVEAGRGGKKTLRSLLVKKKAVAAPATSMEEGVIVTSRRSKEDHVPVRRVAVEQSHEDSSSDPLDAFIALGGEILSQSRNARDSFIGSGDEHQSGRASLGGNTPKRSLGASSTSMNSGDRDQGQLLKEVQALIDERSQYRKVRDYKSADEVRDRLRVEYEVEIFDHKGIWEGPGGTVGPLNKFANPQDKAPPTRQVKCPFSKEEIQDYVDQRTMARRDRDFGKADDLRNMLADNGIELYDKLNEWATYDGSMSGLQSTDFYTGYGGPDDDDQDFIQVLDADSGEVTLKARKKQYADPDEVDSEMD